MLAYLQHDDAHGEHVETVGRVLQPRVGAQHHGDCLGLAGQVRGGVLRQHVLLRCGVLRVEDGFCWGVATSGLGLGLGLGLVTLTLTLT